MSFRKHGLALLMAILSSLVFADNPGLSLPRSITESRYTTAHSLTDDYVFDPRDGWQTANVTDLPYKYGRSLGAEHPEEAAFLQRRKSSPIGDAISMVAGTLNKALKGLKGLGHPEDAVITW